MLCSAIIVLAIPLTHLRSQGVARNDHSLSLLSLFERAAHSSTSKAKLLTQPTPYEYQLASAETLQHLYSRRRGCMTKVSVLHIHIRTLYWYSTAEYRRYQPLSSSQMTERSFEPGTSLNIGMAVSINELVSHGICTFASSKFWARTSSLTSFRTMSAHVLLIYLFPSVR